MRRRRARSDYSRLGCASGKIKAEGDPAEVRAARKNRAAHAVSNKLPQVPRSDLSPSLLEEGVIPVDAPPALESPVVRPTLPAAMRCSASMFSNRSRDRSESGEPRTRSRGSRAKTCWREAVLSPAAQRRASTASASASDSLTGASLTADASPSECGAVMSPEVHTRPPVEDSKPVPRSSHQASTARLRPLGSGDPRSLRRKMSSRLPKLAWSGTSGSNEESTRDA
eukprot:scaffold69281_cov26-Tisochrysis_lutea.AAC.4